MLLSFPCLLHRHLHSPDKFTAYNQHRMMQTSALLMTQASRTRGYLHTQTSASSIYVNNLMNKGTSARQVALQTIPRSARLPGAHGQRPAQQSSLLGLPSVVSTGSVHSLLSYLKVEDEWVSTSDARQVIWHGATAPSLSRSSLPDM